MKKLITRFPVALFLLLMVMAVAQPASAVDWAEVAQNNSGWVWFIDLDSIQASQSNNRATIWEKIEYPNESHRMTLCTYDFSDRRYRDIVIHEYDSNGEITDSDSNPGGWEYIVPESIAESIYLYLKDLLGW